MRLPIELRFKIYEIFLAPFIENRDSAKFKEGFPGLVTEKGLRFNVYDGEYDCLLPDRDFGCDIGALAPAPNPTMSTEQRGNILEIYQAIQEGAADEANVPSGWAGSERTTSGARILDTDTSEDSAEDTLSKSSGDESFEEDLDTLQLSEVRSQRSVSLWRCPDYDVEIDAIHFAGKENCTCTCQYHTETYKILHRLSHISRQFTFELGECLWKNAIVHFSDMELFLPFFGDRPHIWQHVKVLSVDIYHQHGADLNTSTELLLKMSEFVSRYLNLWRFSIRLFTQSLSFSDLPIFEELHDWATAFRSLKVQGKFAVHVTKLLGPDCPPTVIKEAISGDLYNLWLPDTLR